MLLRTMRPRAPEVDPRELALVVRDLMPSADPFEARFELPVTGDRIYLNRAHPAIEGLASFVLESALDAGENRTVSASSSIGLGSVGRLWKTPTCRRASSPRP
jgi:hypothetical protein